MTRTQVQLTDSQVAALKAMAARTGTSVAELVRRGVDRLLEGEHELSSEERRNRAKSAAGRFGSGRQDVSTEHDRHLDEAYQP